MADKILCGVDLGGTKLSIGLFSLKAELVSECTVTDHTALSGDETVHYTAELVKSLLKKEGKQFSDLTGVGVGVAGHINFQEGLIITSSNFPGTYRNYPFKNKLQQLLDAPVFLDNDANAQAFGEYLFGAGQGRDNMVFLTVSTGVGSGIIVEGKLLHGHSGFAGEIGHTIVKPESRIRCTCGNYGCLMALCGTLGFSDRYKYCLQDGMESNLGIKAENVPHIDGKFLEQGLKAGDKISRQIFEETANYIGIGIYNIYQTLNPQTVVLGGGLMKLGNEFFNIIESRFESLVQNMVWDKLEIVPASLGVLSGMLGAAALTLGK